MKVLTILGTRPEIIRLSLIIKKLDQQATKHVLVHTGQNYDRKLSDIFFEQLHVRPPDYHVHLGSHSFGEQIGAMFPKVEEILRNEKPDRVLLLGDTNSALCAMLAERMGIPVYHMEAGNRCFDPEVPEEMNRKVIDAVSTFNLPYTHLSRENLLREGMAPNSIWVSGNPIYEVLEHYNPQIDQSQILDQWQLKKGQYVLVTAHRAENVSHPKRLKQIYRGLEMVAQQLDVPVICSVHPRTKDCLDRYNIEIREPRLILAEPFGFFDFIKLQKHAGCVVTDSGTVQEESCIYDVPAVTIRRSTERPETITCGSNVLSGVDGDRIAECVSYMYRSVHTWSKPEGYTDPLVSTRIVNYVLGGLTYV
ncbi:non-hydrolyzing UDP-N-acetylglucosamine 2-epimerase [Caldalkalibacillus salinus]|uniref:non-hydrolyzing UDP-N-acetylglucosamine 2-epimerase n=1 Tax=Caldalkalibacillus salinus TaxID=2803787 RepID=UPI001921A515|nr:UDP-N-acetylglucosamine 2-epimerase (non-hydrolyzing) [Caldalkalibacillus salinus]